MVPWASEKFVSSVNSALLFNGALSEWRTRLPET